MEIIDTIYKKRQVYTNILDAYPGGKLQDMLCSHMMEGENLIILRHSKGLLFTIMPLTVTELPQENITHACMIRHPKTFAAQIKREYLVVVTHEKLLKVYDFLNLKQICEVKLGIIA